MNHLSPPNDLILVVAAGAAGPASNPKDSLFSSVNIGFRTDDSDGISFPADSNIGPSLAAQPRNIGAFCADDPRESGSIRQSEEPNIGHAFRMLDSFLEQGGGLVQPCLVSGFEGPGGHTLIRVLIIGNYFPLNFHGRGGIVLVDARR